MSTYQLPAGMREPPVLQTEAYLPWSRGRGVDVWAMFVAAMSGDLEQVRLLEARDPALLRCELEYLTPMHFAIRENRIEVVKYLLERGVRPVYSFGMPVTEAAALRGYGELADWLERWMREKYGVRPEGDAIGAAIKEFDVARVKELIGANPELVHAADKKGNRPIHWAVLTRQIDLIDWLLSRGADIMAQRPDGARPLDLTNGDYDYRSWYRDLPPTGLQSHLVVLGWLIARGAYCDIAVAAKIGWYERVKELLDADPGLVNRQPAHVGYYSGLPLRNAAANGHLEVVKLLLARGANPNEPEPGIAPFGGALHSAVGRRHFEIAELLLEHGADANAMVESSGDVLHMAKHANASPELMELVASHVTRRDPDIIAYEADESVLRGILEADAAAPVEQFLGRLISEGLQPMLELILHYQPDILRKQTMLSQAWWDSGTFASASQARWLIERGLNPRLANWLGMAMVHRCAAKGLVDVVEVLVEFGAELDVVESEWASTPLGWAARHGQMEMVRWLVARGADVSAPADRPWARPVEWARRRGDAEMVELLENS
ncbi:MAG TPA: ankyrin repeat domain-containing protein [Puia sp.]|uniref:ankyrin repeat domain-containing protein n=1 Tax=Puia sp. TaxID=2045100 RepID=UPI002CC244EA|nr:ankyrin repeat domain-containing protein [Puia sp.]HVU98623.1 ankyrin repeat domain-containing protein [Puia sp.]